MSITNQEYWKEVKEVAASVVAVAAEDLTEEYDQDELLDRINDHVLHEQIDGHQYTIYYAYHLPILQYSDNAEYAGDNFGDDVLGAALRKGLDSLHAMLAFWAFYADVSEAIEDAIAEYEQANGIK